MFQPGHRAPTNGPIALEEDSIKVDHEGDLLVGLSPETLQTLLAHLRSEPGDYHVPGIEAITFRVTPEQ